MPGPVPVVLDAKSEQERSIRSGPHKPNGYRKSRVIGRRLFGLLAVLVVHLYILAYDITPFAHVVDRLLHLHPCWRLECEAVSVV